MSLPHLPPLLFASLAASVVPMPTQPTTAVAPAADDRSVHARCAQVRAGMNYREALAMIGRPPDSTLSGHTAAGPGGHPPAGSYAIDFWNDPDAQGRQRVSSLRYSGGIIESVDCGRLLDEPASTPSPQPPGG